MPVRKRSPWLTLVPVALLMVAIFCFSAQPADASSRLSAWVLDVLRSLLRPLLRLFGSASWHGVFKFNAEYLLRKLAHFTEYALLGFLTVRHVLAVNRSANVRFAYPGGWLAAWLWAILYAAGDEFHQRFVPGRAGQVRDAALDAAGALCGILAFLLLDKIRKSWYARKQE
ncbi:MAG: VanZ family protein [bacterium]